MKYLVIALLLFVSGLNAQVSIVFSEENQDADAKLTIVVSDSSSIERLVLQEYERVSSQYARLVKRLNDQSWSRVHRMIKTAASEYGVDVDSLQNSRYSFIQDTFVVRVRTQDMTPEEILEFTEEPVTNGRVTILARVFKNANGNLIMTPVDSGGTGRWRVQVVGRSIISVRNMPGAETFYLQSDEGGRMVFRDDNIGPFRVAFIFR